MTGWVEIRGLVAAPNDRPQIPPLTPQWENIDRLKQSQGWLVIFDRRENIPEIEERLSTELAQTPTGHNVTVIRA
jgi:hypothetical protein